VTCANTVTLGAYLLGALDPRERFEFEAHLGGCDTCRTELVRLAPLPGMLNQISLDDFADGLPPTTLEEAHPTAPVPGLPLTGQLLRPEPGFPELLHPELFRPAAGFPDEPFPPDLGGPVPSQRRPAPARDVPPLRGAGDTPGQPPRRRRYWQVAVAAAIALVVAIGGVLAYQATRADTPPAPEAAPPAAAPGLTWTATTADGSATADVRLVDHEWGTEMQVKVHGLPTGRQCYMIVYDREGNREVAGWWGTDHDYAEEIPASTSIQRSRIQKLELRLDDKSLALTIPAPAR
jgi:anti-sigma factor RsiW